MSERAKRVAGDTAVELRRGMADAFFGSAYADLIEEERGGFPPGTEIMDVLPDPVDPAARHAARTLELDLVRANGAPLEALYEPFREEASPYDVGVSLAMHAMGHGVGLFDYEADTGEIRVPHVEFGSYSLTYDYTHAGRVET